MSNRGELIRLRPYDLAGVWGKAFGQLTQLWVDLVTSLMELGAAEDPTLVGGHVAQFQVPAAGGQAPRLSIRELVGETHREVVDGNLVDIRVVGPGDPGTVLVECRVKEVAGRRIRGDLYVGDLVDERGTPIRRIALDIGS